MYEYLGQTLYVHKSLFHTLVLGLHGLFSVLSKVPDCHDFVNAAPCYTGLKFCKSTANIICTNLIHLLFMSFSHPVTKKGQPLSDYVI